MKFSPCNGKCTEDGTHCEGCGRSHEEIAEMRAVLDHRQDAYGADAIVRSPKDNDVTFLDKLCVQWSSDSEFGGES